MKRYSVKCRSGRIEFFDILSEADNGFKVRLTRIAEGSENVRDEFLSKNLFEMCFKTGYIYEIDSKATVA